MKKIFTAETQRFREECNLYAFTGVNPLGFQEANSLGFHYKRLKPKLRTFFHVLCLSVVIFIGCSGQEKENQEKAAINNEKITNVATRKIVPEKISQSITLPATVEPWEDITLSAEIGGKVEWIGLQEGEKVEKGELLVKIDVNALKTAVETARTQYQLAEDQLKRRERLFAQNAISQEMIDQARAARDAALNGLETAKINLDRGHIYTPITGYLNKLYIDEGEFASFGAPVADVIQIDPVKIIASVPEKDISDIKEGREVTLTIDALANSSFSGRIYFVGFKAEETTRTFPVKAVLENKKEEIKPGMMAKMTIIKRVEPNSIVVPLYSIMEKAGERIVFVEEDGVARSRKVEIGIISSDKVQIKSGLKFGENLIIKGQRNLEDGDKVKVTK